jgi:hypothetical protein
MILHSMAEKRYYVLLRWRNAHQKDTVAGHIQAAGDMTACASEAPKQARACYELMIPLHLTRDDAITD